MYATMRGKVGRFCNTRSPGSISTPLLPYDFSHATSAAFVLPMDLYAINLEQNLYILSDSNITQNTFTIRGWDRVPKML